MSQQQLATFAAALVWLALIAYAVLGGADFGGGIWDLLATGRFAKAQRAAIANALGPVWEANNVWLIYVLVVTWTAFPIVYAALSTALFIPITLALIGIILRGAAFGFRSHYGARVGIASVWGRVFSIASTVTPFMLGATAGAIASGHIRVVGGQVSASYWTSWTSPFALACGAFAVGLCSVLAATYLTVEAQQAGDVVLVSLFRTRAILAGAATAVLGAIAVLLARAEAPVLWAGLVGRALPLSLGAVLIGLATAFCLLFTYYRAARILVAAETACILGAWGIAQYPYLIVPDVTLTSAASPSSVLALLVVASLLGMALLLPSLYFLFRVFKSPAPPQPALTAAAFAASLAGNPDVTTESTEHTEAAEDTNEPLNAPDQDT
jgi:cytochrome d ubiquinol oxidase subunit II